MTYGALKLRLQKLFPGVDPELIEGVIQDRYTEVLDTLPWKRSESELVLQAPESYTTGTLAATQGSTTITGTGTVWSSAMDGLMIRINGEDAYYQFTDVNATSATLDRPYEGPTATGLSYRIDQPVFVLPATARIVRQVVPLHDGGHLLELVTPAELDRISVTRNSYGTPRYAVATWDNFSDPPRMQVELYPVPDCPNPAGELLSWGVTLISDQADLDPAQTSTTLLPWVRPQALLEGAQASLKRQPLKDYQGAREHETQFELLVQKMAQVNALQRGPQTIRLAPELRRQRHGVDPEDNDRVTIGPSV